MQLSLEILTTLDEFRKVDERTTKIARAVDDLVDPFIDHWISTGNEAGLESLLNRLPNGHTKYRVREALTKVRHQNSKMAS